MAHRKRHEEHENHERWLVSYADFITLLFAFFVVMYSISQINVGKYRVLSQSLVSAFRNTPRSSMPIPLGAEPGGERVRAPHAVFRPTMLVSPNEGAPTAQEVAHVQQERQMRGIADNILQVLEPLVKEGQVRITQNSLGVAVEINASVLFASGQAILQPTSVKALTAVAKVLAGQRNAVQVQGYSDNTPIRTPQYPSNWELSSARASSVVRIFIRNGVAPGRLVAMGFAANAPVASNATAAGRARNRRVTVLILPDRAA